MKREEEIKNLSENLTDIQVEYIENDTGKKDGLIFYKYADFGKWYADNYDSVEVTEVIQGEE